MALTERGDELRGVLFWYVQVRRGLARVGNG